MVVVFSPCSSKVFASTIAQTMLLTPQAVILPNLIFFLDNLFFEFLNNLSVMLLFAKQINVIPTYTYT